MQTILILRVAVTAGLIAAAIISGTVSYLTLASYEDSEAISHFNNVAEYANSAMAVDFTEKKNAILAIAKNIALYKTNISEWPNVVVPGFYDVGPQQRDSVNLGDISFLPIVQPGVELAKFEDFMYGYYATEKAVDPTKAGIWGSGKKGVYAYGTDYQLYHDKNGTTLVYTSPNKILVPLLQVLFSTSFHDTDLALNMHSFAGSGGSMDLIIECSKKHNYTAAVTKCVYLQDLLPLPLGCTDACVNNYYSSFFQPIYLNQNSSRLVGFINGGFDWVTLLTRIFANHKKGIDVVLNSHNVTVSFRTTGGVVAYTGYGDRHDFSHDKHARQIKSSDYIISMYPSQEFYEPFETNTPIYAAVACAVLLGLCAATFCLYDFYVRKATAANAAVLETKRRFVRFISHEIRTPLNAVHLGLEVLIEEVRRALDRSAHVSVAAPFREYLRSWLELTTEMMANSDSAEEVLNDLLNYDKIEIGALYLDFSSVAIWNIIETGVVVSLENFKQKNIRLSLQNRLFSTDSDIETQNNHRFVVVGDAARLAQVMRTLLSNALKFTPRNGSIIVHVDRIEGGIPHPNLVLPAKTVMLLQQPRAGSILISVTDSGAGLSEAQLAKISTEGVQFNANELQAGKGSGLGLFITKGIVEQHGGRLSVTSTGSGKGTTFAVELPLFYLPGYKVNEVRIANRTEDESSMNTYPRAAPSMIRQSIEQLPTSLPTPVPEGSSPVSEFVAVISPPASAQPSANGSANVSANASFSAEPPAPEPQEAAPPKYLLIVDDAPSNRKILHRIFTSKGYTCSQAEDGQQAIELYLAFAERKPFCAITMDFEMPVMNGPTATKKLRELGCKVPIIGVTGNVLPDDIKYFKAQGATEVLGKPLNVNKFEEVIREFNRFE